MRERLFGPPRIVTADVPQRRENHHVIPRYKHTDSTETVPLTLPQHALTHLQLAIQSESKDDIAANYWAVSKIVRRMTDAKRREFNRLINNGKKTK